MNLSEEIEKLKAQRQELSKRIEDSKAAAKRLDQAIKKLTKTVADAEELLDGIPILEDEKK